MDNSIERYWNDDERDTSDLYDIYKNKKKEAVKMEYDEYIPIYKIIKEFYDEEKEAPYLCTNFHDKKITHSEYSMSSSFDFDYDDIDDNYEEELQCEDDYSNGEYSSNFSEDDEIYENNIYKKFCYY